MVLLRAALLTVPKSTSCGSVRRLTDTYFIIFALRYTDNAYRQLP